MDSSAGANEATGGTTGGAAPLRRRVIQAPMAGGPSTPELAAAVADAGGLGFLAAGYLDAAAMVAQLAAVRELTDAPVGVNVFAPPADAADLVAAADGGLADYRRQLEPEARRLGVELPTETVVDDDDWRATLDALIADPVPVVSFTFGLPEPADVAALHAVGSQLVGTVTDEREAEDALARGMDALCVQGPEAGGHRGTHRVGADPDDRPLPGLVAAVAEVVRSARASPGSPAVPLIAAGGLVDIADVAAVRRAGADAVQLGTAFLLTREAGTSTPHRRALREEREAVSAGRPGRGTTVTRAYTGRPARGLRTCFIDAHDAAAPAAYPQVHQLTKPLRAAAARDGDLERSHLWAGTGASRAGGEIPADAPAAEVVARIAAAFDS
ncbi:nitronate monooxygenase [Nesterenkonia halophila]